jgi:hypothetical protein
MGDPRPGQLEARAAKWAWWGSVQSDGAACGIPHESTEGASDKDNRFSALEDFIFLEHLLHLDALFQLISAAGSMGSMRASSFPPC